MVLLVGVPSGWRLDEGCHLNCVCVYSPVQLLYFATLDLVMSGNGENLWAWSRVLAIQQGFQLYFILILFFPLLVLLA